MPATAMHSSNKTIKNNFFTDKSSALEFFAKAINSLCFYVKAYLLYIIIIKKTFNKKGKFMNNTQKLFNLALQTAQKAYNPYSKFAVGAVILADDGNFYVGCNVENISYPVGTCAETGAISAMIAGGGKKISEILIFADAKKLISPCGACRQRIVEFSDKNTLVHMADVDGIKRTVKAGELLPFGFEEF